MAVAMATSPQAFLTRTLTPTGRHKKGKLNPSLVSCRSSPKEDEGPSVGNDMQLAKLATVTLAAGVLTFGSVHDAFAARTSACRIFRPRPSGPRINNSGTNIYSNPPVAPPLNGGYGNGLPFFGGGGRFEIFILLLAFGVISAIVRRFTGRPDDEDYD